MDRFSEIMQRIAGAAEHLAENWGGAGLAAVAFVDSSFLTLPEIADLLVAVFTVRAPQYWLYYAAMTTLGSVAGCWALFAVGRKGGQALVRRGFHERHVDRTLDWFRRHGAPVLVLPAMLPPPMPFKLFVLVAGVSGLRPWPFTVAVIVGRGLRYGGEAWLARHYGEQALVFLRQNSAGILWPALAVVLLLSGAWWLLARDRGKRT